MCTYIFKFISNKTYYIVSTWTVQRGMQDKVMHTCTWQNLNEFSTVVTRFHPQFESS